jgi:hypothetical protein
MTQEPTAGIRKKFPRTWYHPQWRLVQWYPQGVLNEAFADQILQFIEMEERIQDAPFDRFTDFSGLSDVRLSMSHVFQTARRRRIAKQPAKSAFFADTAVSFSIAQMYERLMAGAMIEVRSFEDRKAVAEWLDVPLSVLQPESERPSNPTN